MIWKPQRSLWDKMGTLNTKKAYYYFRNSSSGYISRKDVRKYIFDKYGTNCYLCNNVATEIDHVISVIRCFDEKNYHYCNSLDNLRPICSFCNRSKKP